MRSRNRTLKFSFGAAALLVFCSSLITLYNSAQWSSEGNAVGQTHAVLSQLQDLQAALTESETGQRGYLLTRDSRFLTDYDAGVKRSGAALAVILAGRLSGSSTCDRLQDLCSQKLAELAESVELGRSNQYSAAYALVQNGRGQKLMDELRRFVSATKAEQMRELARHQKALRKTRFEGYVAAIFGSVLALFSLLFSAWRSHHELIRRQRAERNLSIVENRFDAFMRFNPCLAYIKDCEGRMIYVNAALERTFNIRLADWEGRNDFSLWPAELAARIRATDIKVLSGESHVEVIETIPLPDGPPREYLSVKFAFSIEGSGRFLGGLSFDITERRASELALEVSEKFNRSILESSKDCIKLLSLDGGLLFINSGGQQQLGICNIKPLLNKCWVDFWKGDNREDAARAVAAAAGGGIGRFEGFCATFTGQPKWWHVVVSPVLDHTGIPQRLLCISRDITDVKLAERKVAASEARYRELFDGNPLPAWIYCSDTYRFLDANQKAADHYGYTRAEFLQLKVSDIRVPEEMRIIEEDLKEAIALNRRSGPWIHRLKDGSRITVEITAHAVNWIDRSARLVMVHDVSERVASESKFRILFEGSTDARFLLDDGGIFDCNQAALLMLQVSRKEHLIGIHPGIEFSPAIQPCGRPSAELIPEYMARLETEECVRFDWLHLRADGSALPVEISLSRVYVNGRCFRISVWHDLTERNRAADQVSASLRDKEVLLREIHHRVKNNLQVICSLLSMQSQTVTDTVTLEALRESQDRVQSMAMIHELLYDSGSLSDIDFTEYAGLLAAELTSSYGLDRGRVRISLQIEPTRFSLDQAVPCGLILNELISNALKHAYPDHKSGEIRVGLCRDASLNVHLSVADDGIGLPAGFDWRQSRSLGLRIVGILAHQLGGGLTVVSEIGSAFEVIFPEVAAAPSRQVG